MVVSVKASVFKLFIIRVVIFSVQNAFFYIFPFVLHTTLHGGEEDGHPITDSALEPRLKCRLTTGWSFHPFVSHKEVYKTILFEWKISLLLLFFWGVRGPVYFGRKISIWWDIKFSFKHLMKHVFEVSLRHIFLNIL